MEFLTGLLLEPDHGYRQFTDNYHKKTKNNKHWMI